MKTRFAILIGLLSLFMAPLVVSAASISGAALPAPTSNASHPSTISVTVALPQGTTGPELVSQIGGTMNAIAVRGGYAYVGIAQNLVIFDVTNPAQPFPIAPSVDLSATINDVGVWGDYAYVTDGDLHIIDVQNPGSPVVVGFVDVPADAVDVKVVNNYAYIAASNCLYIYDVTDHTSPMLIGQFVASMWPVHDVIVQGSYAYLANGYYGMRIVDVTNPISPTQIGDWLIAGDVRSMEVVGNYAYLADIGDIFDPSLHILDISNPSAPTRVSRLTFPGHPLDVALSGGFAYIAEGSAGLHVIDVSNPAAPVEVGSIAVSGGAQDVAVRGSIAYLVGSGGVLNTINVANPHSLSTIASYIPVGSLTNVAVARGYAYAAVDSRLHIIDVSQPAQPRQIGLYNFSSPIEDMVIDRTTLYVADGSSGLQVMSLANPAAPTPIGSFTGTVSAHDLAVAGNFVYLADNDLRVIDVSNPIRPIQIGGLSRIKDAITRVTVSGTLAYAIDIQFDPDAGAWYTLRVIDISNPNSPIQTSKYPWQSGSGMVGWIEDLAARGTYLYSTFADDIQSFQSFDVSDPSHPDRIYPGYALPSAWGHSLNLLDHYAFVANDTAGLRILDLANPTVPTEIGFYDTIGVASDVAVVGRYVYVADGSGGLTVLWYTPPTSVTLESGGTLSSTVDGTTYTFPGDIFTDTVVITHTPRYPGNLPSTGDLISIDHFFETTAVYSSTGLPAQPTQPYTLTVQYTNQEKGPAIVDTLALYSWDGTQWVKESSSVVDAATNTITATPNHFSVWAVLGETNRLFLPLIRKTL